ncbi:MAG: hypothetical protein HZB99_00310 [Candidatus Harrisonbacteria bacterium]|nr:hypothetical protein [Candidatus Harrisonbacteria bacterium]
MNKEKPFEHKEPWEGVDESKFYPKKSSIGGFLAEGEKLKDVIVADRKVCEQLEIKSKEIGEKIAELLKRAMQEQGHKVPAVVDDFEISWTSWRGMQNCPFDGSYADFSNLDFIITNRKTGESFSGPGLIAHLLKEHDFFEGHTSYRVDPEQAVKVLFEKEIKKGDVK